MLFLLLVSPVPAAAISPLLKPSVHSLAVGSAIRYWCLATHSDIWYSEASPPPASFAPGASFISIWSNALSSPHKGKKIADCGYGPAQPILDSKRNVLWFAQRLVDTTGDNLVDHRDGLAIIRLELARNSSKKITASTKISWPLALDPASG